MSRSKLILVSDDPNVVSKVEQFAQANDLTFKTFSEASWDAQTNPVSASTPSLVAGNSSVGGGKVLAFPTGGLNGMVANAASGGKVQTINQLEAVAIERAIDEYNGNLTEAAKALGIGRATLYRKVKQYQIDPAKSRKAKKLAA